MGGHPDSDSDIFYLALVVMAQSPGMNPGFALTTITVVIYGYAGVPSSWGRLP